MQTDSAAASSISAGLYWLEREVIMPSTSQFEAAQIRFVFHSRVCDRPSKTRKRVFGPASPGKSYLWQWKLKFYVIPKELFYCMASEM
jgi:hypothetical protein